MLLTLDLNVFPFEVHPTYAIKRPSILLSRYQGSRIEGVTDLDLWSQLAEDQVQVEAVAYQKLMTVPLGKWIVQSARAGNKVIDYMCGTGLFSLALRQLTGLAYYGVDRNRILTGAARARWYEHDELAFYNVGFDQMAQSPTDTLASVLWSYGVLSGASSPDDLHATLTDMRGLLRPGGMMLAVERTLTPERLKQEGIADPPLTLSETFTDGHGFTRTGWVRKFNEFSFTVKESVYDYYWLVRQ